MSTEKVVSLLEQILSAIESLSESMSKVPTLRPADQCEKMPDGRFRWRVTKDHEPAKCRRCGGEIFWMRSRNGKNVPVERSGYAHFDSCGDSHQDPPPTEEEIPF